LFSPRTPEARRPLLACSFFFFCLFFDGHCAMHYAAKSHLARAGESATMPQNAVFDFFLAVFTHFFTGLP
jgi:hypothetical protein